MFSEAEVMMTLAVADAIVQRRAVTWLFYSDGSPVEVPHA